MNFFDGTGKQQENSPDTEVRKVSLTPIEFLEVHNQSFIENSKFGAFKLSSGVIDRGLDHGVIDLLARIKHQDREALRQFYDLYAERIGSFLMKQLGNSDLAGEAVNDVMLAIWQHAGDFDPAKGKFMTWLFGIAHNKGLKIRERARRFAVEQSFEADVSEGGEQVSSAVEDQWEHHNPAQTPEQTILAWELLDALNDALDSLSAEHREILELSYGGEHSYQDIAELLDCPANTVKTRVFHARKKLFERLQRKGYTPTAFQGRWL